MPCTRERAHMSNHIKILARSAHSGGGNLERGNQGIPWDNAMRLL